MSLSEATVDALLDKLASDEEFRAQFKRNPRAATQSLGTNDAAVASLPDAPVANLADMEVFRNSRAGMRKQLLEARAPFNPITLDNPKR